MKDNTETTEKAYTTKEVATRLRIAVPTVRKYAQVLESEQYNYIKSESGARLFVENDINAFYYFMELRQANISVEASAKIVTEKFSTGAIQHVSGGNTENNPNTSEDIKELKEMVHKQSELIEQLTKRLDQQQEYMNNKIEQRDQHLMELMNNTLEEKRELAATIEEDNKKKGFWRRLFKN